jgi:acyl-CoA synthetase (AMP-forming)/AMP-acid ligase II
MASTPAHWGDQIAVEVVRDIPYRMYTERPRRVESVLAFAARWGARAHIVQGDRIVSFEAVCNAVAAKAAELSVLGVTGGDRVFILGWNSPEWVVNFWACLCAGAVPVLANAWWTAGEVAAGVAALQPALVLADARTADKVPAGCPTGPWAIDTTPRQGSAVQALGAACA